jgi:hypothetical protein
VPKKHKDPQALANRWRAKHDASESARQHLDGATGCKTSKGSDIRQQKKEELMFHYQDNGSDCCQKKKDKGSDKHQNETSVRVHQHPRIQGPYMATYARQNR